MNNTDRQVLLTEACNCMKENNFTESEIQDTMAELESLTFEEFVKAVGGLMSTAWRW